MHGGQSWLFAGTVITSNKAMAGLSLALVTGLGGRH
jgi:hypothetical protein